MERKHFASLYPADTRADEIAKIIKYAKVGSSSQLIGLPGVGKSNILELLVYNKQVRLKHLGEHQEKFHFVLINFSEVRNRPVGDVMKFIFIELVESLEERAYDDAHEKVSQIFKDSLAYNDELVLFSGLKKAMEFLAQQKEISTILLFDRFESYVPFATHEFFSYLRILRNRAKYKFSAVFCLNRPLEDSIESSVFVDYYEFMAGHAIFVRLTDKPGMDFRIDYIEKAANKTIEKPTLDTVMKLTGGHGKLTRTCIETIMAQEEKPTAEFLLSQKTVTGALLELWHFLSPSEQQILLEGVKKHTYEPTEFLKNIGLFTENKLAIALFETFLAGHFKPQTNETLTYDANTNTISKGSVVISDKLTVSEFRLLSFLITHPDVVVDREKIIDSVWSDNKLTLGVTDQAVDQLVFRLRKKVENDPNNPTHIQTVKGRGIKFIA